VIIRFIDRSENRRRKGLGGGGEYFENSRNILRVKNNAKWG